MRQLWLYDREAQQAEAAARADRMEEIALAVNAAFGGPGFDKLLDTLRRRR